MISTNARRKLEEIIDDEGYDDIEEWAKDYFDLQDPVDADEIRDEAKADALFKARAELKDDAKIDPLAVTPSALAHGQIGCLAWALVERGDGLILAIGNLNVPIDTRAEARQVLAMAFALSRWISPVVERPEWSGGRP